MKVSSLTLCSIDMKLCRIAYEINQTDARQKKMNLPTLFKIFIFRNVRMYVRTQRSIREASREETYNPIIFAKTVNIYSGTIYTSGLVLCLHDIQCNFQQYSLKNVSLHQRIFYSIKLSIKQDKLIARLKIKIQHGDFPPHRPI